jgi:hypothetical protein
VLAANYGNLAAPGNCPVFPINANGSLGAMTDLFQGTGYGTNAGPNSARQETLRAVCSRFSRALVTVAEGKRASRR